MEKNKWWPLTDEEFATLIKRVNNGDGEDDDSDLCVEPRDEMDAVKLTIAKWHPNREKPGESNNVSWDANSCGCCMHFDECMECILSYVITGEHCMNEGVAFEYACKRLEELLK